MGIQATPHRFSKKIGQCDCCGREHRLEFHHLIPRKNHRKPYFKKHFSITEMRTRGINVCRDCHRAIHRIYNELELGKTYNTLEALMDSAELQSFIEWVKKRRVAIR